MPRSSKIDDLGIGSRVGALRAEGLSLRQIAETLSAEGLKVGLSHVQRFLAQHPVASSSREETKQARETASLLVAQSSAREVDRDLECINHARDRLDEIVTNAAYRDREGKWIPVDERTLVVAAKSLAEVVGKRNSLTGKRVLVDVNHQSKTEIVFGARLREVSQDLFGAHNLTRSAPLALEAGPSEPPADD